MPIVVDCPSCTMRLDAPDETAGKRVRCPKCQTIVNVPLPVAVPPPGPVLAEPAPEAPGDPFQAIKSSYNPRDHVVSKRLQMPTMVRAAAIIWLGFGTLGFLMNIVSLAMFYISKRPGVAAEGGMAMACGQYVAILFCLAFAYCGWQTFWATAADTLGNAIGSLAFGALYMAGGIVLLLAGLGDTSTGLGGGSMMLGIISLGFSVPLLLAGMLALISRKAYIEWHEKEFPDRPRRLKRDRPFPGGKKPD